MSNIEMRNSMSVRDIEDYTKKYLAAPFLKENVYYRRKCVLEQMRKYPHESILEVGCGMFPLFQYIAEGYKNYYIVEPSEAFAENAKKIMETEGISQSEVEIYTAFFEDTVAKFENINFDFVVCSSLLHEIPNEKIFLQSLSNVAKENTVIHINVPNALSIHRLIAEAAGMIDNVYEKSLTQKQLQQRTIYNLDNLQKVVEENGFEVIDKGSYFIKPFTHKQMAQMLEYDIINDKVLDGLWNLIKYFPDNGSEIYVNIRKKIS